MKRVFRRIREFILPQSPASKPKEKSKPKAKKSATTIHPPSNSKLEALVRGPFGNYAIGHLEDVKLDRASSARKFQAAWALMRRYYSMGDYRKAYDNFTIAQYYAPGNAQTKLNAVYEIELLRRLGRHANAADLAARSMKRLGRQPDLVVLQASALQGLPDTDDVRLALWNEALPEGLAPMKKIDPSQPLTIHNLTADVLPDPKASAAKITVVMPVYNGGATIETAMRGVLEQSWRNLELIVVDDASTDDSWKRVQALAKLDERVRPVRHRQGKGAYAARNTGLKHATGDYMTVNDADDWSHPQKFSLHMAELLDDPNRFNMSEGSRVLDNMAIVMRPASGTTSMLSMSSLMVRTEHLRTLGGWHQAQFGADAELIHRLEKHFRSTTERIFKSVPLTLMLSRELSLTRGAATGLHTLIYGSRREYHEASSYWRSTSDSPTMPRGNPFPSPQISIMRDGPPIERKVLLISDYTTPEYALELLQGLHGAGVSVALLHLPLPRNIRKDFAPDIRKHVHDSWSAVVVPGETVHCDIAIVANPAVLAVLPDQLPTIRVERALLLAGSTGEPENEGTLDASVRSVLGDTPFAFATMADLAERFGFAAAPNKVDEASSR